MALTPPVNENDHILGSLQAKIELVEYGDFQCPHCGRAYPIVKRVHETLGDRLRFVFRNFPLAKIHPQARLASVAAEAAGLQNRFWEMHALLFENQRHLNQQAIIGYATSANLNVDEFARHLSDETLAKKVDASFMSGLRSGVNATPTFFINGERYTGSWEGDNLEKFLEKLT